MAYIDSEGRITIDEQAALADCRKEAEAEAILQDAAKQLKAVISDTEGYQGNTVNAIREKAEEMLIRTNKLIANLEEAQRYTKRVVAHYKAVDEQCRAALAAANQS